MDAFQRTEQLLQRQNRLLVGMARGAQVFGQELLRGVTALDTRLAAADRRMKTLTSGVGLGLQRAAETAERGFARLTSRTSLGFQRLAENTRTSMDRAAAATEARWGRAAATISRQFGSIARSTAGVLGSTGTGIGTAIAGLGTGGLGGLVRGIGGIGGVGIQSAANLGAIGTRGLGGALGGALGLVGGPAGAAIGAGIGSAGGALVGGGLQALGGIASGVAQLGANIGGQIVDSALSAVKVGLVAGLGVTIAAVARASEGEQLRNAFKGIVEGAGEDAPDALERLRQATRGTVSDIELLRQTNLAFQLGAVGSTEEMALLAEGAIKLGRAVGRDASEALSDITIGLGRASPRILDNLGIIVKSEAAYLRYATSIGKSVTDLTESERKIAFQKGAIEALREATADLSDGTETFGEKWSRLTATLGNVLESVGKPLLGIVGQIVDRLSEGAGLFGKFLDDNQVSIANDVSKALEGVVSGLDNVLAYVKDRGIKGAFEDLFDYLNRVIRGFVVEIRGEVMALVAEIQGELKSSLDIRANIGSQKYRYAEDVRVGASTRADAIRAKARLESEIVRGVPDRDSFFAGGSSRTPFGRTRAPSFDVAREIAGFGSPRGLTNASSAIDRARQSPSGTSSDPVTVRFAATATGQFDDPPFRPMPGPASGRNPGGDRTARAAAREKDRLDAALSNVMLALPRLRSASVGDSISGDSFDGIFDVKGLKQLGAETLEAMYERMIEAEKGLAFAKEESEHTRGAAAALSEIASIMDSTEEDIRGMSEAVRENVRERERLEKEIKKASEDILEIRKEAARREKELLEGIAAEYERAVGQLQQQFRGALAGASNDPALPRNLRLGFARSDRAIEREVERRLADEFRGVSAGDIGRDPFLRARAEAAVVSTRNDVMRPLEGARDIAALSRFEADFGPDRAVLLEQSKAALQAELEKLRAKTDEQIAEATATIDAAKAALETVTESNDAVVSALKEAKDFMLDLKSEAAKTKKEVESIKNALAVRGKG